MVYETLPIAQQIAEALEDDVIQTEELFRGADAREVPIRGLRTMAGLIEVSNALHASMCAPKKLRRPNSTRLIVMTTRS